MKTILLVALLLPFVVACKKDPPITFCEEFPDECVDVREVKKYFYFKHGSYWVYEEENTGMRDSVFVLETYSDTGSFIFETWLHSTYDAYDYTYWANSATSDADDNIVKKSERSTSVFRAKTKPGDFIAEAKCFLFYPVSGLWTYSYGGTYVGFDNILQIENIFSSYSVLTNEFNNVVQVAEEYTAVEESQPTTHYYSKGVGLIRKELLDSNQIWNLVDYNIEN